MRNFFVLIGIALFAGSCGRQPVENRVRLENRTWTFQKPADFVINITTPSVYHMQVQIRYTQEYSFSNVWVAVNEKSPDGKTTGVKLNIPLFDLAGKPYGSFAGKFFDRIYPDAEMESKQLTLNFPKAGQYEFSLQQNMRLDRLDGIDEVGIRLKAAR